MAKNLTKEAITHILNEGIEEVNQKRTQEDLPKITIEDLHKRLGEKEDFDIAEALATEIEIIKHQIVTKLYLSCDFPYKTLEVSRKEIKKALRAILDRCLDTINKNNEVQGSDKLDVPYILKCMGEKENYDLTDALVKSIRRNRRNIFIRLYHLFGIPYEEFGFLEEEMITPFSPKKSHLSELFLLKVKKTNKRDFKKFITGYPETLNAHIASASERIYIYDYLADHESNILADGDSDLKYYKDAHIKYFRYLESHLQQNTSIQYVRIFAFSESTFMEEESINWRNGEAIIEIIRRCSYSTYEHITRCFKNNDDHFYLYVSLFPTRSYSYGIIDRIFVMSEYFRRNEGRQIRPGMLFINEVVNNKLQDLLEIYVNEIEKLQISRSCYEITKDAFIEGTHRTVEKVEKELQAKEINLEKLKQEDNSSNFDEFSNLSKDIKRLRKKAKETQKKKAYCIEQLK